MFRCQRFMFATTKRAQAHAAVLASVIILLYAQAKSAEDIRGSLIDIQYDLEGGNNSLKDFWNFSDSPCGSTTWAGLSCDAIGNVVGLNLRGKGLSGSLPASMTSLSGLTSIDLSNNFLEGTLPSMWSDLQDLEVLALDMNMLTGSLPRMWAALHSLRELRLRSNRLSGGCLPASWGGGLASLQELDVSLNPDLCNGISVAPSCGRLAALRSLSLRNTGLWGSLPPEWASLRQLVQMDLSSNNLSGTLPQEWATGVDGSPAGLYGSSSGFGGGTDEGGGALGRLRLLDLSNNFLQGTLPSAWSQLRTLQQIYLHSNLLSGTVPEAWGTLHGLAVLRLAGNAPLCGPLPRMMLNGPIATLTVGSNFVSGIGSANGTNLGEGSAVAYEASALAAAINGTALLRECSWAHTAAVLLGVRQSLSDPRGALTNWIEGTDPCGVSTRWWGVVCKTINGSNSIVGLELQDTGLGGSVPAQLTTLGSSLMQLRLDGNNLFGTLPESWSLLIGLANLSVSRNEIGGSLPSTWSTLSRLSYMDLSYNTLLGPLPPSWADGLSNIEQIHLDGNGLNGTLPAAWGGKTGGIGPDSAVADGGLTALRYLTMDGNSLSGALPPSWSQLRELREISLKDNLLQGPVPLVWANMTNLRYLGLSGNRAVCGYLPFHHYNASTGGDTPNGTVGTPQPFTAALPSPASALSNAPPTAVQFFPTHINIPDNGVDASYGSANELRLDSDSTQLGSPCSDSNTGQATLAASVALGATAGASSIGTLLLVALIAAAVKAKNRFRQHAKSACELQSPTVGLIMASQRTRSMPSTPRGPERQSPTAGITTASQRARSMPTTPRVPPVSPHMNTASGPTWLHSMLSSLGTPFGYPPTNLRTASSPGLRTGATPFRSAMSVGFSSRGSIYGVQDDTMPSPRRARRSSCSGVSSLQQLPSPAAELSPKSAHDEVGGSGDAARSMARGPPVSLRRLSLRLCALERTGGSAAIPASRLPSVSRFVNSLLGNRPSSSGVAGGVNPQASPRHRLQEPSGAEDIAAAAESYPALLLSNERAPSTQWGYKMDCLVAEDSPARSRSPHVAKMAPNSHYGRDRLSVDSKVAQADASPSSTPPLSPLPSPAKRTTRSPVCAPPIACTPYSPPTTSPATCRKPHRTSRLRSSPDLGEVPLSLQLSANSTEFPCTYTPVGAMAAGSSLPASLQPLREQDEYNLAAGTLDPNCTADAAAAWSSTQSATVAAATAPAAGRGPDLVQDIVQEECDAVPAGDLLEEKRKVDSEAERKDSDKTAVRGVPELEQL